MCSLVFFPLFQLLLYFIRTVYYNSLYILYNFYVVIHHASTGLYLSAAKSGCQRMPITFSFFTNGGRSSPFTDLKCSGSYNSECIWIFYAIYYQSHTCSLQLKSHLELQITAFGLVERFNHFAFLI